MKEENKCEHDKVYSPMGMTLTCYPPINISHWICKKCGFKGEDRQQEKLSFEYEELVAKFSDNAN